MEVFDSRELRLCSVAATPRVEDNLIMGGGSCLSVVGILRIHDVPIKSVETSAHNVFSHLRPSIVDCDANEALMKLDEGAYAGFYRFPVGSFDEVCLQMRLSAGRLTRVLSPTIQW